MEWLQFAASSLIYLFSTIDRGTPMEIQLIDGQSLSGIEVFFFLADKIPNTNKTNNTNAHNGR